MARLEKSITKRCTTARQAAAAKREKAAPGPKGRTGAGIVPYLSQIMPSIPVKSESVKRIFAVFTISRRISSTTVKDSMAHG